MPATETMNNFSNRSPSVICAVHNWRSVKKKIQWPSPLGVLELQISKIQLFLLLKEEYNAVFRSSLCEEITCADFSPSRGGMILPNRLIYPTHTPETSALWSFYSFSVLEAVGEGPEKGHKDDQKAGAPRLWRKVEGAGLVLFGEEKTGETSL